MISRSLLSYAGAALGLVLSMHAPQAAGTSVTVGTEDNFDVLNDCNVATHGFEIDLTGVAPTDISRTFGAPYNRYGNPTVTATKTGTTIRYASAYNRVKKTWVVSTPVPAAFTLSTGEQCWTGGGINYLQTGCDHFGISKLKQATRTHYYWLIEDPARPGKLTKCLPEVPLPSPSYTAYVPVGAKQPVVAAKIAEVEKIAAGLQFSDAQWVKTYETEAPAAVPLPNLVTNNPAVPQLPSETETEWELVQAGLPGNNPNQVHSHAKPVPAGQKAVVRRYEFYKFTGAYDAESHEALCIDPNCKPQPGEIGAYIGAQMSAANLQ